MKIKSFISTISFELINGFKCKSEFVRIKVIRLISIKNFLTNTSERNLFFIISRTKPIIKPRESCGNLIFFLETRSVYQFIKELIGILNLFLVLFNWSLFNRSLLGTFLTFFSHNIIKSNYSHTIWALKSRSSMSLFKFISNYLFFILNTKSKITPNKFTRINAKKMT